MFSTVFQCVVIRITKLNNLHIIRSIEWRLGLLLFPRVYLKLVVEMSYYDCDHYVGQINFNLEFAGWSLKKVVVAGDVGRCTGKMYTFSH